MDYDLELDKFGAYLVDRVQPGTTRMYVHSLRRWFSYLDGRIPSKELAQSYIDSMGAEGKSASIANLRAHAIIRYFKWKGKTITLDCPTIRQGPPKYLTIQQIEELLAVCTSSLEKTLITVLFDTAVRVSELLALKLDGIDWEQGTITITGKGGRVQAVNISGKALEILSGWLESRQYNYDGVFMGLSYLSAWSMIKNIGKRAGMSVTPHVLRHSRARQMLKSGATLHDVQQHLRHVNINTTASIYGSFTAADLRERIPVW